MASNQEFLRHPEANSRGGFSFKNKEHSDILIRRTK